MKIAAAAAAGGLVILKYVIAEMASDGATTRARFVCSSSVVAFWIQCTAIAMQMLIVWPKIVFHGTPSGAAGAAKSSVHSAANEPIHSCVSTAPAVRIASSKYESPPSTTSEPTSAVSGVATCLKDSALEAARKRRSASFAAANESLRAISSCFTRTSSAFASLSTSAMDFLLDIFASARRPSAPPDV